MPTHLRLHRDEPADHDADAPVTYRFPAAMAAARRTLVAGRVSVPAVPEPAVRTRRTDVIARIDGRTDRTSPTDALIRDIENTLAGMQSRLDGLRRDVDDAFKFPTPPDDDRPRAA